MRNATVGLGGSQTVAADGTFRFELGFKPRFGSLSDLNVRHGGSSWSFKPRVTEPGAALDVTLRLGDHDLKGRFLRCETDGVWLSQDQLVGELARGSRKGHAGGGSGLSSAASAFAAGAPKGSAAAAAAGLRTRPAAEA
jgi:hypothetical protein